MHLLRPIAALAVCCCLTTATSLRAESPPDPLRLIPDQADLMIKVEHPRQLFEAVTTLDLVKQLQTLEAFQELYDSTNARRFYQLVAYFEKQLGRKWPELVDRLAGGGAAIGIKLGPNPAPSLVVVQSKDEELLRKFVKLGREIIDGELARQQKKERFETTTYRQVEVLHVGNDFFAALAGSALLVSNKKEALQLGLDLHLDKGQKNLTAVAGVADARKLLGGEPLVWSWLNMDIVRQAPPAKEILSLPRNDPAQTVLFGGWLDVVRRTPMVSAGLFRQEGGLVASVRMASGREGMPAELAAHLPPLEDGSLPLLEPKGVVYSSSYFMNVSKFWEHRAKLLNAQQLKGLEDFDKSSAVFLAGTTFSKLLGQAGAHQRIVVTHQAKSSYKKAPATRVPAFAFIADMREPEPFAKSMEAILRGAALLAGNQASLKLVEEKHGELTIVGYRFPEGGKLPNDVNEIRFNFSPCFVAVGDQFVAASTLELGHELVDILQKEARDKPKKHPAAVQSRFYASGGADFLQSAEDQVLAQTILDRALSPMEASEEVRKLIKLVRQLGSLELAATYGNQDFRYEIKYAPK